jgi:hypothetical protein
MRLVTVFTGTQIIMGAWWFQESNTMNEWIYETILCKQTGKNNNCSKNNWNLVPKDVARDLNVYVQKNGGHE